MQVQTSDEDLLCAAHENTAHFGGCAIEFRPVATASPLCVPSQAATCTRISSCGTHIKRALRRPCQRNTYAACIGQVMRNAPAGLAMAR